MRVIILETKPRVYQYVELLQGSAGRSHWAASLARFLIEVDN